MPRLAGLVTLLIALTLPVRGEERPPADVASKGMVVCVSPEAAEIGVAVLKRGGTAVDSAIAVGFAMAVTYPAAGNIGGGGFMLVHPATGEPIVFDYRETAPARVNRDTFATTNDWYDQKASGVPGTVRGFELAHKKFGKLSWKELVMPAVELAENGFALDAATVGSLNDILKKSGGNAEFRVRFGPVGKKQWSVGDRLVQKDLARTLKLIAERGADAFYSGELAELLIAEMKAGNGYIAADDLKAYRARERKPIHGTYRGFDVYGAPPPSSGGIAVVEALNILELSDLKSLGAGSVQARHLLAEASRRAFADRARYVGDPDFVKVPAFLTSKDHARKLAAGIDPAKATPSAELAADIPLTVESENTTHFSIVDGQGMAVSNTYTLEDNYGSRVVVRGAGYILNNEMGDFNTRPGVTTAKGRIGTEPNLVAPGKRMLSSQSPTILANDGKVVLVTGSPGGRTIINTVLCVVTNVVDFGMDVQAAVDFPRQHQQWFPDRIDLEPGATDSARGLRALGHSVRVEKPGNYQGDAHSIWVDPKTGKLHGAADRRINGKAAGW